MEPLSTQKMLFNLLIKNGDLIYGVIHAKCFDGDIAPILGGLDDRAEPLEVHGSLNPIDQQFFFYLPVYC